MLPRERTSASQGHSEVSGPHRLNVTLKIALLMRRSRLSDCNKRVHLESVRRSPASTTGASVKTPHREFRSETVLLLTSYGRSRHKRRTIAGGLRRRCAGRNARTDRVLPIRPDEVCVRYVWTVPDTSACPHSAHRFLLREVLPSVQAPRAQSSRRQSLVTLRVLPIGAQGVQGAQPRTRDPHSSPVIPPSVLLVPPHLWQNTGC